MTTRTIVVVDDHPLVRHGLRVLLDAQPGLEVVGEAGSGEEALACCKDLRPDVVVMDLHLPGMSGADATRQLLEQGAAGGVLVLTMFEDDESLAAALTAGARGYLLKGAGRDEVARAVQAVAAGDAVFGGDIAGRVVALATHGLDRAAGPFADLTERERDVLELLAVGLPNAEIARRLFLSTNTVRNHLSNVFAKLHVTSRAEALLVAQRGGLGRG